MKYLRWIMAAAGVAAMIFTVGLTLGLWSLGDYPPTFAYLAGYGAAVMVKWVDLPGGQR